MSQSPLREVQDPGEDYLGAFSELAQRIRAGQSFSGGERNCAFLNRGGGRFADLSYALGLDADDDGRGIALTDLDGDGDVDICATNRTAPRLRLLRNDLLDNNRAIALRLAGDPAQDCPRDAVGARVEVEVGGRVRHRSLAAGDGFASQSSKWLHIGLGAEGDIGAVRVRWPGGGWESFSGVGTSGRFVLRQGAGVAAPEPAIAPAPPLAAARPPLPEPAEGGRIRLSQPLKLPDGLGYDDLDGRRVELAELTAAGKVLVNLWATWCAPCLGELSEFGRFAGSFQNDGVTVVALAVDGLDGAEVSPRDLSETLARSGYSGRAGRANAELVDVFNRLILESIYRHGTLPVPVSFLIDRGGWLSVIYKGPVAPDRVLADAAKLGQGPDVARREALPFAGIWAEGHFVTNPVAVATAYREGGYIEDARAHLEQYLAENLVAPGSSLSAREAMQLADAHYHLGEILTASGDRRQALSQFKAALHFSPKSVRFAARKTMALAEAGELENARIEAAQLRAANPTNPHILALCGDIALLAGDYPAAAAAFEATIAAEPKYIPALNSLARLRATSRDAGVRGSDEAVRLAEFLISAPGATQNARFLSTLAAAYAAADHWDKASTAIERAIQAASRAGDEDLTARLQAEAVEIAARRALTQ